MRGVFRLVGCGRGSGLVGRQPRCGETCHLLVGTGGAGRARWTSSVFPGPLSPPDRSACPGSTRSLDQAVSSSSEPVHADRWDHERPNRRSGHRASSSGRHALSPWFGRARTGVHHGGVPTAPGLRDHHQLPRPGRPVRGSSPGRDRQRPHALHRCPLSQGLRRIGTVTRAFGRSVSITRRSIKNDRLNVTGFVWAFAGIGRAGEPRGHFQRRRAHGDLHAAALRHLFNRFLRQLHH